MAKDYVQKEPSKQEKYLEYRFQVIEHDLMNLQRQVTTIARVLKIDPKEFITALNDGEAHQKYLEELNKAYADIKAKEIEKKPGDHAGHDHGPAPETPMAETPETKAE